MGSTSKDPHFGDVSYVETVVSKVQPMYFSGLFGMSSINLSARAEAGVKSPTACMYALDPTGFGALNVSGLASISSPNCGIVVESNNQDAIVCTPLSNISASQIQVVGGSLSILCGITPTPVRINTPSTPDPLAHLPKPLSEVAVRQLQLHIRAPIIL